MAYGFSRDSSSRGGFRFNDFLSSLTTQSAGSTVVLIWQKDATSNEHVRRQTLPGIVTAGPRDNRINICIPGTQPISPNKDGNFIGLKPGTPEFDMVHTYAVIRMTFALYQHELLFPETFEWNVNGNQDPITVYPHKPSDEINAYYCREKKELVFFCAPSRHYAKKTVYSCRSFDCVAHETGHAILDHLKPHWHSNELPPQTGALHESFGDLTAIFLELSQIDQVSEVLSQTKGNLKNKNFIAELAEELGIEFERPNGMRNANNNYKLWDVGSEVHDLSQVFTGAIYDILARIFDFEKVIYSADDHTTLLIDLAKNLRINLLLAIKASPEVNATFRDVAQQLIRCAPSQHKDIIRAEFNFREILGPYASPDVYLQSSAIQLRDSCCLTLRRMAVLEDDAREKSKRKGNNRKRYN